MHLFLYQGNSPWGVVYVSRQPWPTQGPDRMETVLSQLVTSEVILVSIIPTVSRRRNRNLGVGIS